MRQSCFCQKLQCLVVVNIMAAKNAAVTVRGIFTHAHICHIIHLWKSALCFPKCLLYNTILSVSAASDFILMIRDSKKHNAVYSCFFQLFQLIGKTIQAVTVLPFHGRNLFLDSISFHYKQRIDKRRFVHSGLSHHFSQICTAP